MPVVAYENGHGCVRRKGGERMYVCVCVRWMWDGCGIRWDGMHDKISYAVAMHVI